MFSERIGIILGVFSGWESNERTNERVGIFFKTLHRLTKPIQQGSCEKKEELNRESGKGKEWLIGERHAGEIVDDLKSQKNS